ncbi:hypothetical protein BGM09_17945 [Streptomyces sp. CBMA29]|nr:hypothetical protein [Streptomyces sp. CBMA29]
MYGLRGVVGGRVEWLTGGAETGGAETGGAETGGARRAAGSQGSGRTTRMFPGHVGRAARG